MLKRFWDGFLTNGPGYIVCALVFFLPILPPWTTFHANASGAVMAQWGMMLALGLWLIRQFQFGRFESPAGLRPLIKMGAVFVCWGAVSFLWNPFKISSIPEVAHWTLVVLTIFLAAIELAEPFWLSRIFDSLSAGLIVVIAYGWLRKFLGPDDSLFEKIQVETLPGLANPMLFGVYIALGTPILWLNLSSLRKGQWSLRRIFSGILIIPAMAALAWAHPTTELWGVLISAFIFVAGIWRWGHLHGRARASLIGIVLSMVAMGVFIGLDFDAHKKRMTGHLNALPQHWEVALSMIKSHPLKGIGMGAFDRLSAGYVAPDYYDQHDQFVFPHDGPDQLLLKIWAEMGIVGFCLALGLGAVFLRSMVRAWKSVQEKMDSDFSIYLTALTASLATIAVDWMVSGHIFRDWVSGWLMALILGLTVGWISRRNDFPANIWVWPMPWPKGFRYVLSLVVILVTGLGLRYSWTYLRSERDFIESKYSAQSSEEWGGMIAQKIPLNQEIEEILSHEWENIRQLEKVPVISPSYTMARYLLGQVAFNAGDWPKALAYFNNVKSLKPYYPEIDFALGKTLEKMDQWPEACEHYEESIKIEPNFKPAYLRLYRCAKHTGDLAKKQFSQELASKKGIRLDWSDQWFICDHWRFDLWGGPISNRVREMIGTGFPTTSWERIVAFVEPWAKSGHSGAQEELAEAYFHGHEPLGDKSAALNLYRKSLEGGNQDILWNVGQSYWLGDFGRDQENNAFKWLSKAARLTDFSEIRWWLADLYEHGKGTPKDLVQAYQWRWLAVKDGEISSRDRMALNSLASKMTPDQVKKARQSATVEEEEMQRHLREVNEGYEMGVHYKYSI